MDSFPDLWSGVQSGGLSPTVGTTYPSGGFNYLGGSAVDPASMTYNNDSGAGYVQGTTTSVGTTGGGGTTAGQISAEQQAQQIASLRNEIISRRERANSIFEALTGAVSALAQEKRGQLEQGFAKETENAGEEFNRQSNLIASRYRGRGLGDSSYKTYALEDAGESYQDTLGSLGQQRQAGLGQVGADSATALARIGADRGSVNAANLDEVGRREDGTYDADALRSLRDKLDERIREAEVQQAEFGTQAGFRGQLDKIAPYGGTVDTLRSALTSLAQSAAPKVVKDRIASTIIGNYAPTDQQVWTQFYNEEEQKNTVKA